MPMAWVSGSGIPIGDVLQRYVARLRDSGIQDHEAFVCPASAQGFVAPALGSSFQNTRILRDGLARVYEEFGDRDFAARFSWHSLCRGGCQWAMQRGVDLELVRGHGIWSVQGIQPYLGAGRLERLSVTARM